MHASKLNNSSHLPGINCVLPSKTVGISDLQWEWVVWENDKLGLLSQGSSSVVDCGTEL